MAALFPHTKETSLKFHQVKVKQLEGKFWKLKEKLEETNKLAMETNQTVAKISGFVRLDEGTPKQRIEVEPQIGHMPREFDGECMEHLNYSTISTVVFMSLSAE